MTVVACVWGGRRARAPWGATGGESERMGWGNQFNRPFEPHVLGAAAPHVPMTATCANVSPLTARVRVREGEQASVAGGGAQGQSGLRCDFRKTPSPLSSPRCNHAHQISHSKARLVGKRPVLYGRDKVAKAESIRGMSGQ